MPEKVKNIQQENLYTSMIAWLLVSDWLQVNLGTSLMGCR